jgi:hypothetical protein
MRNSVSRKTVFNQPSWRVASSTVEAYVTETGGQLAPVTFDRKGRKIQPYHIAPWWNEHVDKSVPTIVRVLRGDFFCMPFGGNSQAFRGERFPVHGETANARWTLESLNQLDGFSRLHLSLRTKIRKGRVDKYITLVDGHNAVYCTHVISGMSGPMNLGHHANVRFPDEPGRESSRQARSSSGRYGSSRRRTRPTRVIRSSSPGRCSGRSTRCPRSRARRPI